MRVTRIALAAVLAAFALALAGCGGDDEEGTETTTDTTTTEETTTETTDTGTATGSTLVGTVGPGFTITLTTEDGAAVTSLSPGSYTIEVDDQSDIHNFHLTGPGVEETTEVGEVEQETWDVELEAGSYTYVCDPHASQMTGSFEVTG